ncbi:MAG: LysR family transcriptional regulator [Rhizobiales bacterium]|nr:LysR family transcriptional regulator [Hyphomicrobiales bacterium]
MDIASQMVLFAQVVDRGSFSETARNLGQSPSAVSKQIANLEDRLGVRLLNRSTRHLVPTQEGAAFYEHCASVAVEVREAEEIVSAMGKSPTGKLHIAATVAFAKSQLLPLLPRFLQEHPDISISVELTDRPIDFSETDYDLAIRFSEQINSTSVVVRKLAPNRRVICASPEYIARCGRPSGPEDLRNHNCLKISTVDDWNAWRFHSNGEDLVVPAAGNFEANSADAVYHATLAGLGIARLSTYLVSGDLRSGRLVQLLNDHVDDDAGIYAVYSSRHHLSPKVRVFIDYLAEALGPVPPWEHEQAA